MSTKAELKDARELLDLDVKEVSLVDRPANLRELLVIKRTENLMGVFEADYTDGGIDPSQLGIEISKSDDDDDGDGDAGGTETEVTKAVSAALKTDIGAVVAWMTKMAKGPGAPTDAIGRVATYLGKVASGKETPTQKSAGDGAGGSDVDISKADGETVDMIKARHVYEVSAQKAGKGKDGEDEAAMTKRQKAEAEAAEKAKAEAAEKAKAEAAKGDDAGTKKADTKKSADGGDADAAGEGEPMVVIKRDGSVHVAGQTVQKARSFTNARTEVLSNVVANLAKLLGDVDDEALQKALGDLSKNLSKGVKVDSQVRPTGVTKSAEGDAGGEDGTNAIVEAINKALEPVTKRLEEIEKTRNPSKSVEGDGGSDQTQTTVEKSFWHGVL